MLRVAVVLGFVVLFLGTGLSVAEADVIYSYTGQDFTFPEGSVTNVSGSFTVATLLPESLSPISILGLYTSISFSDGVNTVMSGSVADVTADAGGNLTSWDIIVQDSKGYIQTYYNGVASGEDFAKDNASQAYANRFCSGACGIWSITSTAAVTPEPSTFLLFGSGLIGLAGAAWRKIRR